MDAFYKNGFHGNSVLDIARRVGPTAGAALVRETRKPSDPGDAAILAKKRTDRHQHRPLAAITTAGLAVRALARQHQKAIWALHQTTGRLRSVLMEFYRQALRAFPNLKHKAALTVPGRARLLSIIGRCVIPIKAPQQQIGFGSTDSGVVTVVPAGGGAAHNDAMDKYMIPETHLDLVTSASVALSTINEDGSIQTTAVWVLLGDDGVLRTSLAKNRKKFDNLIARPIATVFSISPKNPLHTLEIRAEVDMVADDAERSFLAKLIAPYGSNLEQMASQAQEERYVVSFRPTRVRAQG